MGTRYAGYLTNLYFVNSHVVLKSKYILLDEPFSELDLVTKYDLMEELVSLADKQSIIILVPHAPFEATLFASQTLTLNNKKIAGLVYSKNY